MNLITPIFLYDRKGEKEPFWVAIYCHEFGHQHAGYPWPMDDRSHKPTGMAYRIVVRPK